MDCLKLFFLTLCGLLLLLGCDDDEGGDGIFIPAPTTQGAVFAPPDGTGNPPVNGGALLTFTITSPASVSVGGAPLNITAIGSPAGGTFSTSGFASTGTNGTFSAINPTTGVFTFSGFTLAGSATINITYTPPSGNSATVVYSITVNPSVTTLTFTPPSPAAVSSGGLDLAITSMGTPAGGNFSTAGFMDSGTNGTFTAINPTTGAFTFTGFTMAGTASIAVTYTPTIGGPITLTYVVNVTDTPMLTITPTSPASVTVGDPDLMITATGTPTGGTYSTSGFMAGTTGGTFTAIDMMTGAFTFMGFTTAGTASIDVTYTPLMGTPVTLTYMVDVAAGITGPALIISGIVDGPRTGGLPKAIELYVRIDIADLSIYGLENATNGAVSVGVPDFTFPAMAVTAGTFLTVASEAPEFAAYFGFAANFVNAVANNNGDDAVLLYESGAAIDVYGQVGMDGSTLFWEYTDGFAYRMSGSTPTTTFAMGDWTFSGIDVLDAQGTTGVNGGAGVTVPFGTFTP